MPLNTFHFLNVKDGDCSIIEHANGHVSIIDVCNARKTEKPLEKAVNESLSFSGVRGNFKQKQHPVNPIQYMQDFGINEIFRFILTHPDMDHMDGIKDLFETVPPQNFWDTDNREEKDFKASRKYREEDWNFYKRLRDNDPIRAPKRLALYAGTSGQYWTMDKNGNRPGDGITILSPTPTLLQSAIDKNDYNDSSYVLLYTTSAGKILFSGDSHNGTWEYILENHSSLIKDTDLLIAPHHGRDSDRDYTFLDTVKPKMTFFGNAESEHLAYNAWHRRELPIMTNNQANCMVVDTSGSSLSLYVTHENFAKKQNPQTKYSPSYQAFYVGEINR